MSKKTPQPKKQDKGFDWNRTVLDQPHAPNRQEDPYLKLKKTTEWKPLPTTTRIRG